MFTIVRSLFHLIVILVKFKNLISNSIIRQILHGLLLRVEDMVQTMEESALNVEL